jgi:hypothetical protein
MKRRSFMSMAPESSAALAFPAITQARDYFPSIIDFEGARHAAQ